MRKGESSFSHTPTSPSKDNPDSRVNILSLDPYSSTLLYTAVPGYSVSVLHISPSPIFLMLIDGDYVIDFSVHSPVIRRGVFCQTLFIFSLPYMQTYVPLLLPRTLSVYDSSSTWENFSSISKPLTLVRVCTPWNYFIQTTKFCIILHCQMKSHASPWLPLCSVCFVFSSPFFSLEKINLPNYKISEIGEAFLACTWL